MNSERVPIQSVQRLTRLMSDYYRDLGMAESSGKKVAWVTSCAPVELLHVAGILPVYPENHAALCGARRLADSLCLAAEDRGFPRDICSYARADFGNIYTGGGPMGRMPKPDLLLCCNNSCGTVTKWYEQLQREFDVPLLMLDTPFVYGDVTSDMIEYVRRQVENIVGEIEDITGQPLDRGRLYETCALTTKATRLWDDLLGLLAHRPAPMTSIDVFVHMAPIVVLRGTASCVDYYETLTSEIRERVAQGVAAVPGERFRLGWDNVPIWFKMGKLAKRFSSHKACIVAATSTAWAMMIDPDSGEDLFAQLARACLTIYLNRGRDARVKTLANMAGKFALDGIVMHSNRSCRPYSLGQYDLARVLRDTLDLPVLLLEADMNDSRAYAEAQINARIDAFMEILATRK